MSEYASGIDFTMVAAADLSAMQYRAVIVSSAAAGKARTLVASQTSDIVFGVLQSKPQAEEAARIRVAGESKAIAGAAVSAGDYLKPTATGHLITGTSGYYSAGIALTGAASGGMFSMVVQPGRINA